MNKFLVFPCVKQNRNSYSGHVISLACAQNINFVLFFPTEEKHADTINYLLDTKPCDFDFNLSSIGIFKTMIDTWKSSGRFLSGIFMDIEYSLKSKDNIITMKLIISDINGSIDSVVKINFLYGIIIAAMERKEIVVSEDLLTKLSPAAEAYLSNEDMDDEDMDNEDYDEEQDIDPDEEAEAEYKKSMDLFKKMVAKDPGNLEDNKSNKKQKLPVDKNLLKIAKKIMSGKRKKE